MNGIALAISLLLVCFNTFAASIFFHNVDSALLKINHKHTPLPIIYGGQDVNSKIAIAGKSIYLNQPSLIC